MEFDEVRRYTPGDDVRAIDWNVTARSNEPHIKRFREERDTIVWLVCDVSASMAFGSRSPDKRAVALEAAAVFGFTAAAARDRVGLICFAQRVQRVVPPASGTRHVSRLLRDLAVHPDPVTPPLQGSEQGPPDSGAEGATTDLAAAAGRVNAATPHRAVVLLISDFLTPLAQATPALRRLCLRHDVVPVVVQDPAEIDLPHHTLCRVQDPETGRRGWVDFGSRRVRRRYRQQRAEAVAARADLFRKMAVDPLDLQTGDDVLSRVAGYLRKREARR